MESCNLDKLTLAKDLVSIAEKTSEPVVVFNGDEECLIAMNPNVFERILFDTSILNFTNRSTAHL